MPQATARSLSRLSKDQLLDLCSKWAKSQKCDPYLTTNRNAAESEEEDYLHEPVDSRKDLEKFYSDLRHNENEDYCAVYNRKELIDRILDGDWRRGLSLYQYATIDFAHLQQNDRALRWTALKLVPLREGEFPANSDGPASKRRKIARTPLQTNLSHYPSVNIATFLNELKDQISPVIKAYFYVHRMPAPSKVNIIRVFVAKPTSFAPASTAILKSTKLVTDPSRSIYIAVPDSCPYIWIAMSGGLRQQKPNKINTKDAERSQLRLDLTAAKRIILEAIPKAFSQPHQRWSLESTKLTARSLRALTLLRGNSRQGSGGAWAQLSNVMEKPRNEPQSKRHAETACQNPVLSRCGRQNVLSKRAKLVLHHFGAVSLEDSTPIDRLHLRIRDLKQRPSKKPLKRKYSADADFAQQEAPVNITFSGADVFAGLKQLALMHPELVNLNKLPMILTGAKNMSHVVL